MLQASAHSHTSTHSHFCAFATIVPRFPVNIVIVKVERVTFLTLAVSGVEKGPLLQDVNCTWTYPGVQNSKKSKATVDREDFAVKIISQLRPTAKI